MKRLLLGILVTVVALLALTALAHADANCTGNHNCLTLEGGTVGDVSVTGGNTTNTVDANSSVETTSNPTATATNGSIEGSGGSATSDVRVEGSETKVYSYGHSAAPAAMGTDSVSAATILGGVGLSQTSKFVKHQAYLAELKWALENNLVTQEEFRESYRKRLRWMERNSDNNDRGVTSGFGLF